MTRTRWGRMVAAAGAAAVATIVALVGMELVCRVLFRPMDYLQPELVRDARLGHRIAPGSGGHDAWGFRNVAVPQHADVVTIGDSMTYGWNAASAESWPGWLARMTRSEVYNLGMGGYGPVQYAALLEDKALTLDPDVVVVGLYYGNDVLDAYRVVYGNAEWRGLRAPGRESEDERPPRTVVVEQQAGALGGVRSWLASNSILVRRLVLSPLGDLARLAEMRLYGVTREGYVHVDDPASGVAVAFAPEAQARALRRDDPRVREGLRLTLDRLDRMATLCRSRGVRLLVVLIPTKESVYAAPLLETLAGEQARLVRALVDDERRVDEEVRSFLTRRRIEHVAALPLLRESIARLPIYPSHHDVHPLPAGYRLIAEAVAERLHAQPPPAEDALQAAR